MRYNVLQGRVLLPRRTRRISPGRSQFTKSEKQTQMKGDVLQYSGMQLRLMSGRACTCILACNMSAAHISSAAMRRSERSGLLKARSKVRQT